LVQQIVWKLLITNVLTIAIPAYIQGQMLTQNPLKLNIAGKNVGIILSCSFIHMHCFGHCNADYAFAEFALHICLWYNFMDNLLFGNWFVHW